jgi:hypothetical protein
MFFCSFLFFFLINKNCGSCWDNMAVTRKIKQSERHQKGAGFHTDYYLLGIQSLVPSVFLALTMHQCYHHLS